MKSTKHLPNFQQDAGKARNWRLILKTMRIPSNNRGQINIFLMVILIWAIGVSVAALWLLDEKRAVEKERDRAAQEMKEISKRLSDTSSQLIDQTNKLTGAFEDIRKKADECPFSVPQDACSGTKRNSVNLALDALEALDGRGIWDCLHKLENQGCDDLDLNLRLARGGLVGPYGPDSLGDLEKAAAQGSQCAARAAATVRKAIKLCKKEPRVPDDYELPSKCPPPKDIGPCRPPIPRPDDLAEYCENGRLYRRDTICATLKNWAAHPEIWHIADFLDESMCTLKALEATKPCYH